MKGGSLEQLKSLHLLNDKGERLTKDSFIYLREGCDDIPTKWINDVELYNELLEKVTNELGFSAEEVGTIWKIVAAVLHVGNFDIDLDAYSDQTSKIIREVRFSM